MILLITIITSSNTSLSNQILIKENSDYKLFEADSISDKVYIFEPKKGKVITPNDFKDIINEQNEK